MKKFIFVGLLIFLQCLSVDAASIMDKWAENALMVRQIPGSEQAVKEYFAADSGIIYAMLYSPANCPRCEAILVDVQSKLKGIDGDSRVWLISDYPNKAAAERYNKQKGYAADRYIYDTNKGYLDFLSFSAGYMSIVYILKIDIDNGKVMYGGNFNNNSDEFFNDLTSFDGYAEQMRYDALLETSDGSVGGDFATSIRPRNIIRLVTADSLPISETKYPPCFKDDKIVINDRLAGACYMFTLDSTAKSAVFTAEIKSNASENKAFVTVPEWYYNLMLEDGAVSFIPLTPQITPSGQLLISYSLPNLFVQEERDGKLLSVGYKNKACIVGRDMAGGLAPLPLVPINTDFSEGYFTRHFTFLSVGDTVIMPCQKLTWPIEVDKDDYCGDPHLDPFCDAFYDEQNCTFAMFDMRTGNVIARFGNLGEAQKCSKTGYYYVNGVVAECSGTLAYSDGESGVVNIAPLCNPDSIVVRYKAFDLDVSEFPAADSTKFYSYEIAAQYTDYFTRRIAQMRLTDKHLHCLVRHGSHGAEQATDIYSYVKIDLATGASTEARLDTGDATVMAFGLWDSDGSVRPYFISRHDGEHYVEVY